MITVWISSDLELVFLDSESPAYYYHTYYSRLRQMKVGNKRHKINARKLGRMSFITRSHSFPTCIYFDATVKKFGRDTLYFSDLKKFIDETLDL